MTRVTLLLLTLQLALTPFAGTAQSENAAAVSLLPMAEMLGDDWVLVTTDFPRERHPAFRAAASATYAGPSGARIVFDVMLAAEGFTAARNAWERGNVFLQWYDANMLPESNVQRDQQLAILAPPVGCSDALRIEGRERIGSTAFPVGVTLCASEPDEMFVAVVSGELRGMTGVLASDTVIELVLTSRASTPTP
jgi:hypothetical protein